MGAILGIFLVIGNERIVRFFDKTFSYPILREGCDYSDKPLDLTYEGTVLSIVLIPIECVPMLFLSEFNYFFNIGVYLGFVIPTIMILFRINTFSDKSILLETGLGYEPRQCWVLSFLNLAWPLAIGFSSLYFSDNPFYFSLITITLALFCSMIFIFPDYVNKFLSYDIRSEKGYWFLKKISATTIFIQGLVFIFFSLFVM